MTDGLMRRSACCGQVASEISGRRINRFGRDADMGGKRSSL